MQCQQHTTVAFDRTTLPDYSAEAGLKQPLIERHALPGTGIDPETRAVHYVLWVLCGDDLFVQTRGRGDSSKVKLKVKPAGVWQSKLDLRAWVINQLKQKID